MRTPLALSRALYRRVAAPRASLFEAHAHRFRGGIGLEIGGDSQIFSKRGLLPVYPIAKRVDAVNFALTTAWETLSPIFRPDEHLQPGRWLVGEMTALPAEIKAETYDFTLSSHALEHTANPIKALRELRRVLKPGGSLLLILPDRRFTFDHRRQIASLEHLREDYERNVGEDDQSHIEEIVAEHDRLRDREGPQTAAGMRARCEQNLECRCMHHHVFDVSLVRDLMGEAGFRFVASEIRLPFHIIVLAERAGDDQA